MTGKSLSTYFKLHRRYYRSVNLERDFDQAEMVQGYVPTERSADALRRILSAFGNPRAHRIWTMTGVYGTGKSAFAHYLTCLCAPTRSESRRESLAIAKCAFGVDSSEMTAIESQLPQQGLFRAVATAQREPLSCTIARALVNGAETYWQGDRRWCQQQTSPCDAGMGNGQEHGRGARHGTVLCRPQAHCQSAALPADTHDRRVWSTRIR